MLIAASTRAKIGTHPESIALSTLFMLDVASRIYRVLIWCNEHHFLPYHSIRCLLVLPFAYLFGVSYVSYLLLSHSSFGKIPATGY